MTVDSVPSKMGKPLYNHKSLVDALRVAWSLSVADAVGRLPRTMKLQEFEGLSKSGMYDGGQYSVL